MLGSFEVRTDEGVLADVPGDRLRGLLSALALEPGRVVPKVTLVDWIWGENLWLNTLFPGDALDRPPRRR